MSAIGKIKKMFVLMLENRSYDNLLGWSDLRGWTPDGIPTQADGLLGKPAFVNRDKSGRQYVVAPGAPFCSAFDPGHEFSDVLTQLCGPAVAATYADKIRDDSIGLPGGQYPQAVASANDLGFAYDLEAHGFDVATGLRGYTPDQLPVLNFLAQQYAVCDRWFSSMPGPTWPNRFFALAGTSWGLDHSPNELETANANVFEQAKFGNGRDSLLTVLKPEEWLVARGDMPQSWALKGITGNIDRFIRHQRLFDKLQQGQVDASFIFIEPAYDPLHNFRNGDSMHPCGDVRAGDQLVEKVYNALLNSPHWEESLLLIVFDEHGGFFDHVIPTPEQVPGMPQLMPTASTPLTKRGFRFDRYGFRVPAIIVSPYVKQATIDHRFYDHVSMAKTLALVVGRTQPPLLPTARFANAADFSAVLTLDTPRKASEIHPCPAALPIPAAAAAAASAASAKAFSQLHWDPDNLYGGA